MTQKSKCQSPSNWFTYIVQCDDGTLYTGITTDPQRRIKEHNSPAGGAKYTRIRQPITLAYLEPAKSRSDAAAREYALKKMKRSAKLMLIHKSKTLTKQLYSTIITLE